MDKDISKLISVSSWFVTLQIITLSAFLGCAAIIYLQMQDLRDLVLAAPTLSVAEPIKEVKDWQQYVRGHNATTTQGDAQVTILEFTDFQCPYCRRFNATTKIALQEKYGDRIQFVFKHFPLEAIHTEAKAAAIAAQCALREGKFWGIKDAFFENPGELSQEFLLSQASALNLLC